MKQRYKYTKENRIFVSLEQNLLRQNIIYNKNQYETHH